MRQDLISFCAINNLTHFHKQSWQHPGTKMYLLRGDEAKSTRALFGCSGDARGSLLVISPDVETMDHKQGRRKGKGEKIQNIKKLNMEPLRYNLLFVESLKSV